jgi:hypothetical protein
LIEPARVASREYPRQARLQEERLPRTLLPEVPVEHGTVQRYPRQHEAPLVEFDGPLEPSGIRVGTDEHEEGPGTEGPVRSRAVLPDRDPVQAVLSQEFPDLRAGEQFDVLGSRDPVDEVTSTCSCPGRRPL